MATATKANDRQVGGRHYKQHEARGQQPWDVITAWNLGFLDGNAVKYLSRWRTTGRISDLEKAAHYIQKQIEVATAEKLAK
jgi:hypothetical protein